MPADRERCGKPPDVPQQPTVFQRQPCQAGGDGLCVRTAWQVSLLSANRNVQTVCGNMLGLKRKIIESGVSQMVGKRQKPETRLQLCCLMTDFPDESDSEGFYVSY